MDKQNATEKAVQDLAEQVLRDTEYSVYDVTFGKEGSDYYLRVFIDTPKEGGIDLNDCERVTELLNQPLDDADPVKEPYFFEVSSPGVERSLRFTRHFEAVLGQKVYIKTFVKIDNAKERKGVLTAVSEDSLTLACDGGEVVIPRKHIAKAALSVF